MAILTDMDTILKEFFTVMTGTIPMQTAYVVVDSLTDTTICPPMPDTMAFVKPDIRTEVMTETMKEGTIDTSFAIIPL